jgi:hypothetical protein
VTPPLIFRTSSTTTGALETGVAAVLAAAAPIGWPVGRMLYGVIIALIPERLQAYPIAALIWAAVLSGAPLPLLYDPSPSLTSTLLIPWLLAQIPGAFASAAAYGVLEGWLAIDGSSDWWPLTPAQRDVDDTLILGPAPVSMPTLLDPAPSADDSRSSDALRVPRRRPAPVSWIRLVIPATIATAGSLWYLSAVASALASYPASLL